MKKIHLSYHGDQHYAYCGVSSKKSAKKTGVLEDDYRIANCKTCIALFVKEQKPKQTKPKQTNTKSL